MARRAAKETDSEKAEVDDALHPRLTSQILGHQQAISYFLSALQAQTLHHAWLITGEPGIGKATFAYSAARTLLSIDGCDANSMHPTSLNIPYDSVVFRQIANVAHPSLFVLTGDEKTASGAVSVDHVRKLREFLGMTSPTEWRCVIVDATNNLTNSSANALLKALEEPPRKTVFFLIGQGAASVMPTIRSRCIRLSLRPLSNPDFIQAMTSICKRDDIELPDNTQMGLLTDTARGSPGRAVSLLKSGASSLVKQLDIMMRRLPLIDHDAVQQLIGSATGVKNAKAFERLCDLIEEKLEDRAKTLSQTDVNAGVIWADLWSGFRERRLDLETLNLDKGAFLIAAISDMEEAARAESK